jgi:hypothetical protein
LPANIIRIGALNVGAPKGRAIGVLSGAFCRIVRQSASSCANVFGVVSPSCLNWPLL